MKNWVALPLALSLPTVMAASSVVDLRTEGLVDPLGVDVAKPRFSWLVQGEGDETLTQNSYRVVVTEALAGKKVWDSGLVNGAETSNVVYSGSALSSDTSYNVAITSTSQDASQTTSEASFRTGLMNGRQDLAKTTAWITGGDDKKLLRTAFNVSSADDLAEAVVYVSGIGYHELYCNGAKVGDHRLDVGWTDYARRVYCES